MEIFFSLIVGIWGVRIVLNIFSYANLWWVKEYRFDRMIIHMRTVQGKRILRPEWRLPPITPKSVLLVLFSLTTCGYLARILEFPIFFRLAIADLVSFPVTWIFVMVLNAPTLVYHKILIAMAIGKLRCHKPMTVIGITGSYGKTSTKEYLSTILSAKYHVLKTVASKNAMIGIAEVVLKKLDTEHDMFVVEMGAYKTGEIKHMAAMVQPQIGIVTAINEQHQDLFGSMDNTMAAKYELIQGLCGKRIAIFQADDKPIRTIVQWAGRDGCNVWDRKCRATDVHATFQGLTFTGIFGNEKVKISVPVVGVHQVDNILLAIAGAVAAGMTFNDAAHAAGTIKPASKVLEIVRGINGSTFIIDTFNNNPDAARAALDVLSWGKAKKILVFQPMIELGSFAASSHEEVGSYAADICDEIMLTNRNFYESFVKGVAQGSGHSKVSVLSAARAAAKIRSVVKKGDVVLFKGKEAEGVLQAL